mgnify:CR=1 FL=1
MITILLVEDNETILKGLEYTLKLEGFGVASCRSKAAFEKVMGSTPCTALTWARMIT